MYSCMYRMTSTAFSWGKLQGQQQQQYSYKCDIELIATKATSIFKIYVKIYIRSFGAANICCC